MKKNLWNNIYIAACVVICALPFVCMTFARTDTTTENKTLTALPALTEKGAFNTKFLPGLGDYFNDHFAFRQQLVSADAEIQSKVFKVSNVDTVVAGKDGWLYYTDDLDDYLGKTQDERAIYCAAHNLALTQQYVTGQGAKFLVTIPPNKSTLYGGQMPYYYNKKISKTHNYELLAPALGKQGVSYVDLFTLFKDQQDTLYLKRDSHWDNRGALLACNAILDAAEKTHDDYAVTPAERTKTEVGDLGRMLYPVTADPEWNVYYEHAKDTAYVTETKSVEDPLIETENKESKDTLLMYRDSFGNALIPFMADAFGKAVFSKMAPYNLAADMEQHEPKYVILEKVERNISEFASDPPVMPAPEAEPVSAATEIKTDGRKTEMTVETSQVNMACWRLAGEIDPSVISDGTRVYLTIRAGEEDKAYEAFLTCDGDGHYGFSAYLPKEAFAGDKILVTAVAVHGDTTDMIGEQTLVLPEGE